MYHAFVIFEVKSSHDGLDRLLSFIDDRFMTNHYRNLQRKCIC